MASPLEAANSSAAQITDTLACPIVEIVAVIAVVEIDLWKLCGDFNGIFRLIAYPLLLLLIVRSSRRRRRTADRRAPDGATAAKSPWWPAWLLSLSVTLALSGLLLAASVWLRGDGESFRWYWLQGSTGSWLEKLGTVAAQQWALHLFLWPLLLEVLRRREVARHALAIIFGLVHLPSLTLVVLTMVAGYIWSSLYQRTARLTPLIVSHLVLAVLAHAALPERMNYSMRVGAAGLAMSRRYRQLEEPALASLHRAMCSGDYFAARGGTNRQFVTALYLDVMRRTPADPEVEYWLEHLRGHCRADLVVRFLTSEEFAQRRAEHPPDWAWQLVRETELRLADDRPAGHRQL